jgi:hypothetical protein
MENLSYNKIKEKIAYIKELKKKFNTKKSYTEKQLTRDFIQDYLNIYHKKRLTNFKRVDKDKLLKSLNDHKIIIKNDDNTYNLVKNDNLIETYKKLKSYLKDNEERLIKEQTEFDELRKKRIQEYDEKREKELERRANLTEEEKKKEQEDENNKFLEKVKDPIEKEKYRKLMESGRMVVQTIF